MASLATKRLEVLSEKNRKKNLEYAKSLLKGGVEGDSGAISSTDKKEIPKLLKASEIPLF